MDKYGEYFKNKIALVTGASSGIGQGVAIALSKLGSKVYAVGRSQERLNSLKEAHPSIEIISVNLENWSETESKLGEICKKVDLLVNNAGLGCIFTIDGMTEADIDNILNVNLKAPINLMRLVSPGMKERKSGAIVNVSSVASLAALKGHIVYSASKGGLDMVTKVGAYELGPHNVRVNSVNPTVVLTPMSDEYWSEPTKKAEMTSKIPMGRFVEIDEVVNPIVFLLSDSASMMNGTILPIDGGFVAS